MSILYMFTVFFSCTSLSLEVKLKNKDLCPQGTLFPLVASVINRNPEEFSRPSWALHSECFQLNSSAFEMLLPSSMSLLFHRPIKIKKEAGHMILTTMAEEEMFAGALCFYVNVNLNF